MQNHTEQTIIAQCTPQGAGSIALIRLSGSDALLIGSQFAQLSNKKNLVEMGSHTIHYGKIVDQNNKIIDQVLFLIMKSPNSFTGENVLEITCHNNIFIIEQIITLAIKYGARLAQPGEFAKRAVLNGKLDLLQAEAINEVIGAQTQQALKKSLSQIEGSFSNWIQELEKKLLKCLALSEASFEFIDDEIEFGSQILEYVQQIGTDIQSAKEKYSNQRQIKEGIRIAIVGSVNAGKSSIFNALLKKNRAIVSNIAGTTRDSIEAGIYYQNCHMSLVDTAGLRQTDDLIEKEGIKRSMLEAQMADIILLTIDGSREITFQELKIYEEIVDLFFSKIIAIINKSDLIIQNKDQFMFLKKVKTINVSAKENRNIDVLQNEITNKVDEILQKCDSPFLLNKRQYNLLVNLENKLHEIEKMLHSPQIHYELLSIHINEALASFSELTGKNISECAMDQIFKEFCVGK